MRSPSTIIPIAAALAGAAGLTACTGPTGPPKAAPTNILRTYAPPGRQPCLAHQTAAPNAAYRGGITAQTPVVLHFLGYYTKAGDAPFCAGATANKFDIQWATLYVQLTGNAARVQTILRGQRAAAPR